LEIPPKKYPQSIPARDFPGCRNVSLFAANCELFDMLRRMKIHAERSYTVHCTWDAEASVWYVSESDVPGLVTEAATVEEMNRKLEQMIPELLEANAVMSPGGGVPFELLAHRHSTARANAAPDGRLRAGSEEGAA
jgi:predicted RNase H-like HicB family nuclease